MMRPLMAGQIRLLSRKRMTAGTVFIAQIDDVLKAVCTPRFPGKLAKLTERLRHSGVHHVASAGPETVVPWVGLG
jgi:hypothetical protein